MENAIVVTPQEIVNVVLAICGAIITISGAGTVIIRAIAKAKEPNKKQNDRLDAIESEIRRINDRLKVGDNRFEDDRQRMEQIETSFIETTKIIIEGLQALTSHAIDGNNTDNLKKAQKKLDDYLRDAAGEGMIHK